MYISLKKRLVRSLLVLFFAGLSMQLAGADDSKFTIDRFKTEWLAKKGLLEESKSLDFNNRSELVHQALMRFDKRYSTILSASNSPAQRRAALEVLIKNGGLDKFSEAEVRFRMALSLLRTEDYERAVEQFERIEIAAQSFTPRRAELRLFTAYCYGKLEDSARAIRVLSDLIARGEDCPERYIELAHWFRRELRGQGTGPLLELSKSMQTVERLLRKTETGFNPTGKRQQDIVKELTRLIDLLEQKKKGKGKGKGKGQGKQNQKQQSKKNGRGNPLDDSKLPGGDPNIKNLQREPRRGVSEAWGKLNEAERKDVIDAIRQRFPGQYKELIEQYFKNMSDKSSQKSTGGSNN